MKTLKEISENAELLEIGRKAIEDTLLSFRNGRISLLGRGNGLVIREKSGDASEVIRMGPEDALRVGMKAIDEHLQKQEF